jgi:flagellar basal-body rod protein FlgB
MIEKLTDTLNFHSEALLLRGERQRVLASNIANADTPGYVARDFNFGAALRAATQDGGSRKSLAPVSATDPAHIALRSESAPLGLVYSTASQPSADRNTVDLDRERANFVDNSVRYEATLKFVNTQVRTMLTAIQGQ